MPVQRILGELLSHRTDLDLGDLRPLQHGTGPRYRSVDGRVEALDSRLEPTTATAAPGKVLTASPDLETLVLLDGTELVIRRGGTEVRATVPGAGSATLLSDGRVLVTGPVVDTEPGPDDEEYDGDHRVLLIDTAGAVISEVELDVWEAGVLAFAHPHDGSVILEAAQGQDGGVTYLVRVVGDVLQVERILEDVTAADFSPSGDRLLVMPYSGMGHEAQMLSWPGLTLLAELSGDDVLDGDEHFDSFGSFLSESRVVMSVAGGMPLVCSADLAPEGRVALPPEYAGAEAVMMVGLAENTIGLRLYLEDAQLAATVWQVGTATSS